MSTSEKTRAISSPLSAATGRPVDFDLHGANTTAFTSTARASRCARARCRHKETKSSKRNFTVLCICEPAHPLYGESKKFLSYSPSLKPHTPPGANTLGDAEND